MVGSGQRFLSHLAFSAMITAQKLSVFVLKRGLLPDKKASREDLLERVRANLKPSRSS